MQLLYWTEKEEKVNVPQDAEECSSDCLLHACFGVFLGGEKTRSHSVEMK
jgi:hypothetical protein